MHFTPVAKGTGWLVRQGQRRNRHLRREVCLQVARDISRIRPRVNLHYTCPDASASTLPARAPRAGCGAHLNRQVNELLHEEAYFLNRAPSCDDAAHREV